MSILLVTIDSMHVVSLVLAVVTETSVVWNVSGSLQ